MNINQAHDLLDQPFQPTQSHSTNHPSFNPSTNHYKLQLLFSYFPRNDLDEDNPENEKYAIQFCEQLIQMMEEKAQELSNDEVFLIKLKLQESAAQFRQMYSSNPMNLVRTIKNCLAMEAKIVEQADSVSFGGSVVDWMDGRPWGWLVGWVIGWMNGLVDEINL